MPDGALWCLTRTPDLSLNIRQKSWAPVPESSLFSHPISLDIVSLSPKPVEENKPLVPESWPCNVLCHSGTHIWWGQVADCSKNRVFLQKFSSAKCCLSILHGCWPTYFQSRKGKDPEWVCCFLMMQPPILPICRHSDFNLYSDKW